MQSRPKSLKSTSLPGSIRWADIIKVVLALGLIGVVFSKTSLEQIVNLGRSVSWPWLLFSFLLFWILKILKGLQYWALLGYKIPFLQIIKIVVLQNALSNVVADTAGIASYFSMFRMESNVNFRRSGLVLVIAKIGDLFGMAVFLSLSAVLVWARIGDLHQMTLVLLAGVIAGLLLITAIVLFRMKFVLLVKRIVHRFRLDRFRLVESGVKLIQSIAKQDRTVFVRMFLLTASISMVYMTATMFYFFSRAQVFHIPIDFWASVYIVSVFQFISMIPIQIFGGLGVVEFTLMYFYTLFAILHPDIPAALIGGRVLSYLFSLVSLLYLLLDMLSVRSRSQNLG